MMRHPLDCNVSREASTMLDVPSKGMFRSNTSMTSDLGPSASVAADNSRVDYNFPLGACQRGSTTINDSANGADNDEDPASATLRRVAHLILAARILVVLAVIGLASSITLLVLEQSIVNNYVTSYVAIPNSAAMAYNAWQNPEDAGITTYRRYYFYNITNPFEMMNGVAPKLIEVGPFTYTETSQKYDIRWYLNGSVGYKYKRVMHFVPELSFDEITGMQLNDSTVGIITMNPALKGILYRVGKLPAPDGLQYDACTMLESIVNGSVLGPKGYFTQRTPREFLWGYVDAIWNEVHPLIGALGYTASTTFMSQWNGSAVVPSAYTYRSGQQCPLWQNLADCNNTDIGFTMEVSGRTDGLVIPPTQQHVGAPGTWLPLNPNAPWPSPQQAPFPTPVGPIALDTSQHGKITQWAGQQSAWWWGPVIDGLTGGTMPAPLTAAHGDARGRGLDVFSSTPTAPLPAGMSSPAQCRQLGGSEGTRFAAALSKDASIDVFVDMIGRYFTFSNQGTVDYDGIEASQYRFADSTVADSDWNRYCYGMRFQGLFNVSRPAFGPGIASNSMFQGTCFYLDGASVPNDANGARKCVDRLWTGPNGYFDGIDDGFTGRSLTLNLTFLVPPVVDPTHASAFTQGARPPPQQPLTFDNYLAGKGGAAAYDSYLDVHRLSGVTLKGVADAMVSVMSGPFGVDGCGLHANYTLINFTTGKEFNVTVDYFTDTLNLTRTVLPFLRMLRSAEATGYWVDKLKSGLQFITIVTAILWTVLGVSCAALILALVLRFVLVPKYIAGDPATYEVAPQLALLSASQQRHEHQQLLVDQ
jgi:hypothetical protein